MALIKNPMTRKRLDRFRQTKRAHVAFWVVALFYGLSLVSELICNDVPLLVRFNERSFFPVVKFYPEETFLQNGRKTRPDYKSLAKSPLFDKTSKNYMVFAPIPYGPYESIPPESIPVADEVRLVINPQPIIGTVYLDRQLKIVRVSGLGPLFKTDAKKLKGRLAERYFTLGPQIRQEMAKRFENRAAPRFVGETTSADSRVFSISLATFKPRPKAPKRIRLTVREKGDGTTAAPKRVYVFNRRLELIKGPGQAWQAFSSTLAETDRELIVQSIKSRFLGQVDGYRFKAGGRHYKADFEKEDVRFPYRPIKGHWLGIDSAGRDVLVRILYGLRTSLTFGLLLVGFSMVLGVFAGALQGYYGGLVDITAQRLIEIWSALPFLYIMILMGSVYGRSFGLLLFCYGIFNWIGISYYVRAEFLRLRQQPFVEAAKCMGISTFKIIFKHILPNGLVPVITFFPFSLVGAIGALAALDYLGFGLPAPTPSWGEMLLQAQQFRWAWWLILYPSLALFVVMLCGVFVGEGVRNAYDPKRFARLE